MTQSTGTPANITDASAASDTRSAQARRLSAAADVIYENVDHDSGIDYGAAEEIARAVVEALGKVPDDAPKADATPRTAALTPQQMRDLADESHERMLSLVESVENEWGSGASAETLRQEGDKEVLLADSVAATLRATADQLEAVQAVVKRYAGWYEGGPEDSWRVERDLRTALGMEQYSGDDHD